MTPEEKEEFVAQTHESLYHALEEIKHIHERSERILAMMKKAKENVAAREAKANREAVQDASEVVDNVFYHSE
jgi:hypothetical protein